MANLELSNLNFDESLYVKAIQKNCIRYRTEFDNVLGNAVNKVYARTIYIRDVLSTRSGSLKNKFPNSEVLHFIMDQVELGKEANDFSAIQTFCKMNSKYKLKKIANEIAEYKALIEVWDEINQLNLDKDAINVGIKSKNISNESEMKLMPSFKEDILPDLFQILKDYFILEQHDELQRVLKTWGESKNPLTFNGSGNKLADAFRKIFESQMILNCTKKELQNWIAANFCYLAYGKKLNRYTEDYLEKNISRMHSFCKKPILWIKKGLVTNKP